MKQVQKSEDLPKLPRDGEGPRNEFLVDVIILALCAVVVLLLF